MSRHHFNSDIAADYVRVTEHVSKISRILRQPKGNALLLGVGGSGRQSLTRLAVFCGEMEEFQIQIAKGYGKTEWREDVKKVLMRAGRDNQQVFGFMSLQ